MNQMTTMKMRYLSGQKESYTLLHAAARKRQMKKLLYVNNSKI